MSRSNYHHIEVDEIISETENAFKVRMGDDEVWLPKSQIADAGDYSLGNTNCTMSITEWIAKTKGLL